MRTGFLLSAAIAAVALAALAGNVPGVRAHEGRVVGDYELVVGFLHEPAFEGQINGVYVHISGPGENHSHDDAAAPDTNAHGEVFGSGTVNPGTSYTFTPGNELDGLTVPFHDHLTGLSGAITVDSGAIAMGDVSVAFTDSGFSPGELTVPPGTGVVFTNRSAGIFTVVSGLHDSVTGDDQVPVAGADGTLDVEVTHLATGISRVMSLRPVFGDDGSYVADFVPTAPGVYEFRFFGEIEDLAVDETFTAGPGSFDEVRPAREIQFPIQLAETRELESALRGVRDDVVDAQRVADSADSSASIALIVGIAGLATGLGGFGAAGFAAVRATRGR